MRCWPARLEEFWNQKRKHVFALRLAKKLIEKDESLNRVSITEEEEGQEDQNKEEEEKGLGEKKKGREKSSSLNSLAKEKTEEIQRQYPTETSETNSSFKEKIPLFIIATKNGKEEIVLEIMKKYPDAIVLLNETNSSLTRKEHIPLFIATIMKKLLMICVTDGLQLCKANFGNIHGNFSLLVLFGVCGFIRMM